MYGDESCGSANNDNDVAQTASNNDGGSGRGGGESGGNDAMTTIRYQQR